MSEPSEDRKQDDEGGPAMTEEVRVRIDERTEAGKRALAALKGCPLPLRRIPSSGTAEIYVGEACYVGAGQISRFVARVLQAKTGNPSGR